MRLKRLPQKGVNSGQELKIDINPKNGQLKAWALMKVVDSVSNPKTEVHIEKAQAIKPGAVIWEYVRRASQQASKSARGFFDTPPSPSYRVFPRNLLCSTDLAGERKIN